MLLWSDLFSCDPVTQSRTEWQCTSTLHHWNHRWHWLQIVWWKTLEEKLSGELAAETEVFGGEEGATRKADVR